MPANHIDLCLLPVLLCRSQYSCDRLRDGRLSEVVAMRHSMRSESDRHARKIIARLRRREARAGPADSSQHAARHDSGDEELKTDKLASFPLATLSLLRL